MKRLRDQRGDDPAQRRGVELLQRTPATPRVPEMKRRVWHSLQRDAAPHVGGLGLGRGRLRLAVAAIALLALAGTAAAMIRGPLGARLARVWAAPAVDAEAPATGKGNGTAARRDPPAPLAMAPAPVTLAPAPSEPSAPRRRAPAGPPARGAVAARGAASAQTATARERTEVLDALVALRRDHEPARAGAMLSAYLSSHPRGALHEEALALAIEAADAQGDRAAGERLSRSYTGAYPNGRFVAFARRHFGEAAK